MRIRPSALLSALVAVVVLVTLAACGGSDDGGGAQATPAPYPTYQVASRVLQLTDPSRTTDPTSERPDLPVTQGRSLPTTLWYPAPGQGDGPFPLIVFSHGFRSDPEAYEELLSGWAAAGFVVAAPTFPLSSLNSPGVTTDVLNQPADVSFVLTQVLGLNTTSGDDLFGRIDTAHIAAAGHSAGAITTVGELVAATHDPRFTAALVLAGSDEGVGTDFATPYVPLLVVHGTGDTTIKIADGRALYQAYPGPKALVELPDGTHSSPYDTPSDPLLDVVRRLTTDYLRWALNGDKRALTAFASDADRPSLADLTGNQLSS